MVHAVIAFNSILNHRIFLMRKEIKCWTLERALVDIFILFHRTFLRLQYIYADFLSPPSSDKRVCLNCFHDSNLLPVMYHNDDNNNIWINNEENEIPQSATSLECGQMALHYTYTYNVYHNGHNALPRRVFVRLWKKIIRKQFP